MPEGTIHSAHMLVTPHYTQITGTGDFTKLNVRAGDSGGELDPHGADGTGNPRGGLVYAQGAQIQEWNSFVSSLLLTLDCFDAVADILELFSDLRQRVLYPSLPYFRSRLLAMVSAHLRHPRLLVESAR